MVDSAYFTEKNVKKAHGKKLSFISLVSKKHKLREICIKKVLMRNKKKQHSLMLNNRQEWTFKIQ